MPGPLATHVGIPGSWASPGQLWQVESELAQEKNFPFPSLSRTLSNLFKEKKEGGGRHQASTSPERYVNSTPQHNATKQGGTRVPS